jgi:hypothetical protein
MVASQTYVLTFPSRVRTYYQASGADTDPVVTNDGFTNTAALVGDDRLIAGIPADDLDSSSASQSATLPTIEKTISQPAAPGAMLDCSTATYIDADDLAAAPFAYRSGDIVCYTLHVDIPANLTFRDALVSDFMPAGVTLQSSVGPTAANDVLTSPTASPLPLVTPALRGRSGQFSEPTAPVVWASPLLPVSGRFAASPNSPVPPPVMG